MSYRSCEFLTPAEEPLSTDRALSSTRTLERLGQRAGVEGGSGGRQVCLLGFSHTMNQVKLSAPDSSRLKANEIADPNETAGIPIRRQEPSARTSFQGSFRRGEIIERLIDDG